MPSIPLHADTLHNASSHTTKFNNLPLVLQTPSGLAILEIQGTIHAPFPRLEENSTSNSSQTVLAQTPIGRLEFPLFDPLADSGDLKWMKRVYLYVGKHQRLTGEVKKLSKPLMVIGKRPELEGSGQLSHGTDGGQAHEELEVLEVVRHKILFGGRPEPVGE